MWVCLRRIFLCNMIYSKSVYELKPCSSQTGGYFVKKLPLCFCSYHSIETITICFPQGRDGTCIYFGYVSCLYGLWELIIALNIASIGQACSRRPWGRASHLKLFSSIAGIRTHVSSIKPQSLNRYTWGSSHNIKYILLLLKAWNVTAPKFNSKKIYITSHTKHKPKL